MKYKVCINSGHAPNGDPDPGAEYHGLKESDINCSVGHQVLEELVHRGYEVTFVQDDSLEKVCNEANNVQTNLFISLHCNAFGNENVGGTEVYVYNRASNCYKAAEKVCNDICHALGTDNRGVKEGKDLYVLKHTTMPAMLIEMFFLSNKEDIQKFKHGFNGLVNAICNGVDYYFA